MKRNPRRAYNKDGTMVQPATAARPLGETVRILARISTVQSLSKVVADRRRALGIRQEALEFEAGLHAGDVSKIETGARPVTMGKLMKVMAALGLQIALVEVTDREVRETA